MNTNIKNNDLNEKLKLLLSDYVDKITTKARRNKNYICPLCGSGSKDQHTSAFSIGGNKKSWTCFSCGEYGDIFTLVGKVEHITEYREQVKKIQELFNLGGNYMYSDAKNFNKEEIINYNSFFLQANRSLNTSSEALEYLKKRCISLDTANKFNLGYVASWKHPKTKSNIYTPRLIIPNGGNNYLARDIREYNDIPQFQKGYIKSRVGSPNIYNIEVLKDEANEVIFIVEGEIDAISIYEATKYNAIALCSVSNCNKLISYLTQNKIHNVSFLIALDNDSAGDKTAQKLKKELDKLYIKNIIYNLCTDCKDVNEQLVKDKNILIENIEKAVKLIVDNMSFGDIEKIEEEEFPSFPVECLSNVLKDYCLSVANCVQAHTDMIATIVLGVLSTCLQDKIQVEINSEWIEPVNLYILTLADSGERKSTVFKYLTNPILKYETEVNQKNKTKIEKSKIEKDFLKRELEEYEHKLLKSKNYIEKKTLKNERELKMQEYLNYTPVIEKKLICGNITIEKLAITMQEQGGRIAISTPEASGVFENIAGLYNNGNSNIDLFCQAYTGEAVKVDRVSRESINLAKSCLTMNLSIQPGIITKYLDNNHLRDQGLFTRFLYSFPPSLSGTRKLKNVSIDTNAKEKYFKFIESLLNIEYQEIKNLILSHAAYETFKSYFDKLENELQDNFYNIKGVIEKMRGNVARIAGLLHVSEVGFNTLEISNDTIVKAIKISNYFIEQVFKTFNIDRNLDDKINAKWLLNKIQSKGKIEYITIRDLYRRHQKRFKNVEDIKKPLLILENYNYIKIKDKKIFLNPLIF